MSNKAQPNKKQDTITYEEQFKIASTHFKAARLADAPIQIVCAGLVLTYRGQDATKLLKLLEKFCTERAAEYTLQKLSNKNLII